MTGHRILAAAMMCLGPFAAMAQTFVLPSVTVDGRVLDEGYVATESTSGTKTDTPLIEVPQSVSVVTRAQMDQQNVQSVGDALRYSAGVLSNTSAISQRNDSISIRGFDASSTGIMRDGLRSTTAQAWPKAEPYGLERIDILRGPSSMLFGQNSPGGLINQISKRPTAGALREVEVQAGSFDRYQGQFDLSGPIDQDGRFLYRLTALARSAETQFKYVPDDKIFVAPAFTWAPSAETTLTVLTDYTREKFGPPRPFIPIYGTVLANPNGKLPRNQFLDEPGLRNDRVQASAGYLFDQRLGQGLTFRSNGRYAHVDLTTNTASGTSLRPDFRTLNRTGYHFEITGDTYAIDNQLQADWRLAGVEMVTLAGFDYRRLREDYLLLSGAASAVDIYSPVYGKSYGPIVTPGASTMQTANQYGLYAQQQARIADRLVFTLNGRQDWSLTDTLNRLRNTGASQDDKAFTWRAGVSYLAGAGFAPYVSYATSFLPVLGTNFYGQPYKPMKGEQWEAGVKYQPDGWAGFVTASLFDLRQTNVRTQDPNNALNQIQTGEVRSRGLELQGVAQPLPGLDLVGTLTFNDLEVTKSNNPVELGKRPTGMPAQMASAWADYTIQTGALAGFGFGGGVRYVGSSKADAANTITVPSYTLADAAVHYTFGSYRVAVNATNLFNTDYYSTCSTTSCNQGYDRSVIASLRLRW
ncbi:MAG: TonB-dependent siderophore receptor [Ferrovibrionaceae bacterium]